MRSWNYSSPIKMWFSAEVRHLVNGLRASRTVERLKRWNETRDGRDRNTPLIADDIGYTYRTCISSEAWMQVAKWGNSLAVRLPRSVVAALGLKEGDSI